MANSPTPSSPSMPDRGSQTEAHVPDHKLPENSRENLDSKLDLAIEETFPTSDPVSVKITKGGAIDYDQQDRDQEAEEARQRRSGEGLWGVGRPRIRSGTSRRKPRRLPGPSMTRDCITPRT